MIARHSAAALALLLLGGTAAFGGYQKPKPEQWSFLGFTFDQTEDEYQTRSPRRVHKVKRSRKHIHRERKPKKIRIASIERRKTKEVVRTVPTPVPSPRKPRYDELDPITVVSATHPPLVPAPIEPRDAFNIFRRYDDFRLRHAGNAPTELLPRPLKGLLVNVAGTCGGFKVISTVCGRGAHSQYVRGTGRVSLHCLNRAADFFVDSFRCAYKVIREAGWQGGMSSDAGRVNHIHVSYAPQGREWKTTFVHGARKHYASYRHHRHAKYAVHKRKIHFAGRVRLARLGHNRYR